MEIREDKKKGQGDLLITRFLKNIYLKQCKKERERDREAKDNNPIFFLKIDPFITRLYNDMLKEIEKQGMNSIKEMNM